MLEIDPGNNFRTFSSCASLNANSDLLDSAKSAVAAVIAVHLV